MFDGFDTARWLNVNSDGGSNDETISSTMAPSVHHNSGPGLLKILGLVVFSCLCFAGGTWFALATNYRQLLGTGRSADTAKTPVSLRAIGSPTKPPPRPVWPQPVSRVDFRPRRPFDLEDAIATINYPKVSTGGLLMEDRRILAEIYQESESVFEMGVGESTKIAVYTGVPRYTGVDGALEWLDDVTHVSPPHYRFHWADIGKIGSWSYPTDQDAAPKWPFYSVAALSAESEAFDFYLVDGRFRVACVCACFLHASLHGRNRDEFNVGIHDFTRAVDQAPTPKEHFQYKDVLELAEVVRGYNPVEAPLAKTAILSILRRKPGVTDRDFFDCWEKHAQDTS